MAPSVKNLARALKNMPANLAAKIESHYTRFLRMHPQLETLAEQIREYPGGREVRIAYLGNRMGAELYSALYVLRTTRPDLRIRCYGIDISDAAAEAPAKVVCHIDAPASGTGLYVPGRPELLDCDLAAVDGMFERLPTSSFFVRDWLREDITWMAADAKDAALLQQIGTQDIVLANFMEAADDCLAESCLRNVASLVEPGGIILVDGVDAEVKTRVLTSLCFVPVVDRLTEAVSGHEAGVDHAASSHSAGSVPHTSRRPAYQLQSRMVVQGGPSTQTSRTTAKKSEFHRTTGE